MLWGDGSAPGYNDLCLSTRGDFVAFSLSLSEIIHILTHVNVYTKPTISLQSATVKPYQKCCTENMNISEKKARTYVDN